MQGPVPTPHATKSLQKKYGQLRGPRVPSRPSATKLLWLPLLPLHRGCWPVPVSPCDRTGSPSESSSQSPLDDLISLPDCSEVDFDTFMMDSTESPDEDWMGNLRLISGTEDQAADKGAKAQSVGHVPRMLTSFKCPRNLHFGHHSGE